MIDISDMFQMAHRFGQRYITDDRLRELFEIDKKHVQENTHDGLAMLFGLYGHNVETNEWTMMPVMFADWPPPEPLTKEQAMIGIGAQFVDTNPGFVLVAVSHMSEMWLVKQDPDEYDPNVVPSTHKDRIEGVMAHIMTIDQRSCYYQAKIIRDEKGKFERLETTIDHPYEEGDNTESSNMGYRDFLSTNIFKGYLMARKDK
jgi:hypothetical protein